MSFVETDLGFEYKASKYFVFFGKKDSSLENLKSHYKNFEFKSVHQVHGDFVTYSSKDSSAEIQADAHWTDSAGLALACKTADCIPLLAYSPSREIILSVHAGWRGVQQRIIPKALDLSAQWEIYIGPHILRDSFEIQSDCLELLRKCTSVDSSLWYANGKADLDVIVKDQINKYAPATWHSLDTKTDLRFHSFRRDGSKSGRQNSFIVKL